MSTRLESYDFSKALDNLMRTRMPAPYRSQQAWLGDWSTAAEKMHYMDIQKAAITDSLRSLIQIRGKLRRPNLSLELIKPDVERLWTEMTTQATESAHSIRNTESGFECSFFAVVDQSYITGSVTVNRSS